MTRATPVWYDIGDGRAVDRRLTAAVGASLVIHALVIASLRGVVAPLPAQTPGVQDNFGTLQAVLAGPRTEVEPSAPTPFEPPTIPALFAPPLAEPIEVPTRRPQFQAPAPAPGPVPRSAAERPPISIAIKPVEDPSRLGPEYVLSLAQRFPRRASKAPALRGSPAVVYPRAALDAGMDGRVAALVTLDEQGHVLDSTLLPEGGLFSPAVADALKTAQFAPAEIDGKPVPYWAIVEFFFNIARPSPALAARQLAPPAR